MSFSLDFSLNTLMVVHIMARYSTNQVAAAVGVHKSTLLRWLYAGRLAEPAIVDTPTSVIRVWSDADLTRVKRYKEQNYRKGRGRKKKV